MIFKHCILILIVTITHYGCKLSQTTPLTSTLNVSHDVVGVNEALLTDDYWITKANGMLLMLPDDIVKFNQQLIRSNKYVVDPLKVPEHLNENALIAKINQVSSIPKAARYYRDGTQLTAVDFTRYALTLNKANIVSKNIVHYGLVTNRSSLRTFPTEDRVFNKNMDFDLDRFQESAVFPGEAVAVLHYSADKRWALVQNYHYLAWMQVSDLAIGDKNVVNEFVSSTEFLIITGDKVVTNYNPVWPQLSEKQLDMGVKLPLLQTAMLPTQVDGQNPYTSHIVTFPFRQIDGSLTIKPVLIAKSQDVHIGYLPFTEKSIILQSFKFLGERYGWGHDYNARDCTGFIGEVYKTFGIKMPRNSGQQGRSLFGVNYGIMKNGTLEDKLTTLRYLRVGDLIYIPGHVMIYIGEVEGQPYVIHDVKGFGYLDNMGQYYEGTLSGVAVTPLLPLRLSAGNSYIDNIYAIKRVR